MELDSRKKSRRNCMMRLKSFGTQEVRPEGSRRVERFSHLMDGNIERCLPDERNEMQKPGKIENM